MQKQTFTKCWEKSIFILCRGFHQSHRLRDDDFLGLKNLSLGKQSPLIHLVNDAVKVNETIKPPEFMQFLKNYAFGFRTSVRTLMTTLNVNRKVAKGIVLKHSLFEKVPTKFIEENYSLLKDAGLTEELMEENALILVEEPSILVKKIKIIKRLDVDLNLALPLLTEDLRNLKHALHYKNHIINYKIQRLKVIARVADNLQINEADIKKICNRNAYQRYLKTIETKIQFLERCGLDIAKIDHCWWQVLHYSHDRIKRRIKIAMKFGWQLTPDLISCSTEDLYFKRKLHIKLMQPLATKQMNRFQFIKQLSRKTKLDPMLLKFKLFKFDESFFLDPDDVDKKIDLLRQEGYSYSEIIWNSEVLKLPFERLQKRIYQLNSNNYPEPNILVFLLSDEQFSEHVSVKKCEMI